MKQLLFIYHDKIFLEFIKSYLELKHYNVFCALNGLEGIRIGNKELPDLIVLAKNVTGIDLEGLLIKKRINPNLKNIPLFLIGNFNQNEFKKYSNELVKAFISIPINPHALLERLNLFFNINTYIEEKKHRTPMLTDMHIKGNIIIIQIEGNFEPDKLEILNYEIRTFCKEKDIKNPKILLIIPSIYPESLTEENLFYLLKFLTFKELNINNRNIKVLSQCQDFLKLLKKSALYNDIELVSNFIDGIQRLNLDIDNKKEVSIKHLREGASYIFDLYDDSGMIRIPAMSKVTKDMIDYLLKSGETKFTYYSDIDIDDLDNKTEEFIYSSKVKDNYEKILTEFDTIDNNYNAVISYKEDKLKLFFSKLRDQQILVVSFNKENNQIIKEALDSYFKMVFIEHPEEMFELENLNYIAIFLDLELSNPDAIELLKEIRMKVPKEKTSVIITAKSISKEIFDILKNNGTDNILISPFSHSKVMQKVFESVSSDRD